MAHIQVKDGTKIFYYDWGQGLPVVLIHGWPLTSASWECQARVLAESGHRVIAYDRRGFGQSDWAYGGYDFDTLASDLNELMESLDLKSATLVGFSMGSGEVARFLARYGSGRVAKAVLISAVTPYLLKTKDNPEGVEGKVFDQMVDALKQDRAEFLKNFWLKFYGRTMVHHTVSEALIEFTQMMAMTGSPKATIDLVRAWSETDFRKDLVRITVPTLVIHGTGDETVPIHVAGRRTATLIPGAELLEYDRAPHGLTVTSANRLNADLLEFLRRETVEKER